VTEGVDGDLRLTGIEEPGRVDGAGTQRSYPGVSERARRRTFTANGTDAPMTLLCRVKWFGGLIRWPVGVAGAGIAAGR
jgi:hypothetical protein